MPFLQEKPTRKMFMLAIFCCNDIKNVTDDIENIKCL